MHYGSDVALTFFVLGGIQLALYSFERWRQKNHVKHVAPQHTVTLITAIICFCFSLGIIRAQFEGVRDVFVCEKACEVDAVVVRAPELRGEYQRVIVHPIQEESVYDVVVRTPLYPRFTEGERVTLFGKVLPPKNIMEHDGTHGFDYVSYLRIHDIGSEMLYPSITRNENNKITPDGIIYRLHTIKSSLLVLLSSYIDEPSASLASGMLLGDRGSSESLIETFRIAGLSHIVVLSGFNIAILISFILFVLKIVPLTIRIFCASVIVIVFVLMVGAEVSILRATVMSSLALVALSLGRLYTARQALLLSLLVIVMYEPSHLLYDASLHLSFLATAGIVYMSKDMQKLVERGIPKMYREVFTTTLCAYLLVLPYSMYTFGTVSLYALIANLLVLPCVPVMMLLTFLVVTTAPISHLLGMFFGYLTTVLGNVLIAIAHTVTMLPYSSLHISISFTTMIVLYGILTGVYVILLRLHSRTAHNETRETKNEEIFSEVISY
jgi:competence protein ComEC